MQESYKYLGNQSHDTLDKKIHVFSTDNLNSKLLNISQMKIKNYLRSVYYLFSEIQ